LVQPAQRRSLLFWIFLTNIPFLIATIFISFQAIPAMVGFLFFSIFYSAPPIRAKTKPFLDSAFNILYVFPGIFAYQLVSGDFPPILTIFAATCWTFAMHAYSAIPDISADRKANIKTVATQLGANGTLALCLILYVTASFLVFQYLHVLSLIFSAVYALMIAVSFFFNKTDDLFKAYKFFPVINAAVGFTLFWFIAYSKFI
jgi:lycopene elongase/hydratase (dihydrobisanhydrobacterioruberin-forming)